MRVSDSETEMCDFQIDGKRQHTLFSKVVSVAMSKAAYSNTVFYEESGLFFEMYRHPAEKNVSQLVALLRENKKLSALIINLMAKSSE